MKTRYLILLAILFVSLPLSATVLIEYNIAGYANLGATSLAPSVYDPRLLLSDEVVPEALTMQGASPMNAGTPGLFFSRGWPTSAAKNPNQYFEFRLIVLPDYYAELDNLTYSFGREDWQANAGANAWELHASYDQFDKSDILLATVDTSAVADYFAPGPDTALTVITDLSGLDANERNIDFRWYGYGGIGSFASGFINQGGFGSNVTLNGELYPIPEPLTVILLSIGSLVVLRRRS